MDQREKLLLKVARLQLRDLPIGAYVADAEGRIVEANRYARELFELPSEGEVEASVADYYPASALGKRLSATAGDGGGGALHSPPTLSISVGGREVHLHEYSRPILDDETGEAIGFLSCVEDVTREYSLRHKVEELTYDIGQMLHTYTSTLLMTKLTAESVMRGLQPDPFPHGRFFSAETAVAALAKPARACAFAVRRLLERVGSAQPASQTLPEGRLEELRRIADLLEGYEGDIQYKDIIPTVLQDAALTLLEVRGEIGPGLFPRELIREVEASARELVRLHSLIQLHQLSDAAVEMGHTVRALREFIISGDRAEPPKATLGAAELVARAVDNLREFAQARGVRLRRKMEDGGASVEVSERDVVRALVNILHNAIKYSWSRGREGGDTWVQVHTYVEGGRLCFRVVNYGVPVPKEEIERGLIFELGYRGRMSGDRGRIGTGIGLADARHVARAHGGDLTVESRPATAGRREDDYEQPFVTSVTFSLPLRGEGRR
jgi:signal transduction histidine kinase